MDELQEKDFWCGISENWRYPERFWTWSSHNVEHWSLVLAVRGTGFLRVGGQEYTLDQHDIFLIAPGIAHVFSGGESWELLWVHFVLPLDLLEILRWQEVQEGVRKASLALSNYSKVRMAMQEVLHLYLSRPKNWFQFAHALLTTAILRIDNSLPDFETANAPWLQKAQEQLRRVPCVSIDEIAAACGLSRTLFFEQFHQLTGYTPAQYRDQERLRNAEQLLLKTNQPVGQIADSTGFNSICYFSLRFKERYGTSPRQYRQLHKISLTKGDLKTH